MAVDDPEDGGELFDAAMRFWLHDQPSPAKDCLLRLVAWNPQHISAWVALADIAGEEGDHERRLFCEQRVAELRCDAVPTGVAQAPAEETPNEDDQTARDDGLDGCGGGRRVHRAPTLEEVEKDDEPNEALGRPERFREDE